MPRSIMLVLAVVVILLSDAASAKEIRTATFYPDQAISGQTSLEVILETEVSLKI